MGVSGLLPFLRKKAPSAVTLGRSLADFTGQTLAIDASLLMNKIHFSGAGNGDLHPHRHVLQWYRILQHFQTHSIDAIVVFDGKHREKTKSTELIRRRAERQLQEDRGLAESARRDRVRAIKLYLDEIYLADMTISPEEQEEKDERQLAQYAAKSEASIRVALDKMVDLLTSAQLQNLKSYLKRGKTGASKMLHLYYSFLGDPGDKIYSKSQKALRLDENEIFEQIFGKDAENVGEKILALVKQSEKLQDMYRLRNSALPPKSFAELKQLLDALGIPYIEPSDEQNFEAEAICAKLWKAGKADWVLSDDTDVLMYGAPVIRNFTTRQTLLNTSLLMQTIKPERVWEELGLTQRQFLEFGLLCGTDFNKRIPGIGPIKAFDLIRKYGTLEAYIMTEGNCQSDLASYLKTWKAARKVFLQIDSLPDYSILPKASDPEQLRMLREIWDLNTTADIRHSGDFEDEERTWDEYHHDIARQEAEVQIQ